LRIEATGQKGHYYLIASIKRDIDTTNATRRIVPLPLEIIKNYFWHDKYGITRFCYIVIGNIANSIAMKRVTLVFLEKLLSEGPYFSPGLYPIELSKKER